MPHPNKNKTRPNKVARPIPSKQYLAAPADELYAGQLFRVRDKDWERVWAQDLTHDEATKLKEQLSARGKSRTARVESMTIDPPDWYTDADGTSDATDNVPAPAPVRVPAPTPRSAASINDPQLEAMRRQAVQASQRAALNAQAKAASVQGARPKVVVPARPVPVVSTELDENVEDDGTGLEVPDMKDLLGGSSSDIPGGDDLQHAKDQAEQERLELESRAQAMYAAARTPDQVAWEQLTRQVKAHWVFEAQTQLLQEQRAESTRHLQNHAGDDVGGGTDDDHITGQIP